MADTRVVPGLAGKTAVVTGGMSGIGRACVELLESSGCTVHVVDMQGPDPISVTDKAALEALAARIGPTVDVLVNAAGILPPNTTIEHIAVEDARRSYEVNVIGTLNAVQAFGDQLKRAQGAIVNIASQAALVSLPAQGAYTATKGAVAALTRSIAIDWAEHGVRANSVCPGFTVTAMTEEFFENEVFVSAATKRMPLNRLLAASEIAGAVVFLASPLASGVTGVTLPVDAGWTAGEPALPW